MEKVFKPENLSPPSKRALLNLFAGKNSNDGLVGRSEFGGHLGTLRSLARQGLVALSTHGGVQITDDGRVAAARILALS